jgi:hypothetical protein
LKVVCDENGIGGNCEYCGDKDTQLDRINVLCHGASYHTASGGTYEPARRSSTSSPA